MQTRRFLIASTAAFLVATFLMAPANLRAQSAAALTGVVSSDEEGQMEGVVVNARRDGATAASHDVCSGRVDPILRRR